MSLLHRRSRIVREKGVSLVEHYCFSGGGVLTLGVLLHLPQKGVILPWMSLLHRRSRIVREKGVSLVEHYCFEEHEDLKRAAMECMCNLVMNEAVSPAVTHSVSQSLTQSIS